MALVTNYDKSLFTYQISSQKVKVLSHRKDSKKMQLNKCEKYVNQFLYEQTHNENNKNKSSTNNNILRMKNSHD